VEHDVPHISSGLRLDYDSVQGFAAPVPRAVIMRSDLEVG
jgi:hypothetical protein